MEELQLNHTYLIQFGVSDTVASITPLLITAKAYNIRWNSGYEKNDTWELKATFHRNWNVIEDISDYIQQENIKRGMPPSPIPKEPVMEVKTKNVTCYVCHGLGTIPDPGSTGGTKVCPRCLGAKMTPEVSEIISR